MSDGERYQQAARRASTTRRYTQAIEHFEGEGSGLLPASATSVVRYLAAFGPRLSASTLRTNLAALAQWHLSAQHQAGEPAFGRALWHLRGEMEVSGAGAGVHTSPC